MIEPSTQYPFVADFRKGMNRAEDPSKLVDGEYSFLINGRTRFGNIETIFEPQRILGQLPEAGERLQAIYAAGSIILAMVDGKPYYRNFAPGYTTNFRRIGNVNMSALVEKIYIEAVPTSSLNYLRSGDEQNPSASVSLLSTISERSPQALVIQDGITRPHLIFPNGTGRPAMDFSAWTTTNREYVPIGTHMLYDSSTGKLYIVSPNGLELFHGVSGRPLDFVIAVDSEGNKLAPLVHTEQEASRLSYSWDFTAITALAKIPANNGEFFASTLKSSYVVIPNFEKLVYGEPTFGNTSVAPTGALNGESVVDIRGDTAFIEVNGITSFNSVQQFQVEGNNSPFSQAAAPFLKNIKQDVTAGVSFDNYGLFALKTIFGYGVLVYDNTREAFVSLDKYDALEGMAIKQFAELKLPDGTRKLFFSAGNALYEAYASPSNTSPLKVYPRNWSAFTGAVCNQLVRIYATVQRIISTGTISATTFLDNKRTQTLSQMAVANYNPDEVTMPFGDDTADSVRVFTFSYKAKPRKSYVVGPYIEVNFPCEILSIGIALEQEESVADIQQQATYYKQQ